MKVLSPNHWNTREFPSNWCFCTGFGASESTHEPFKNVFSFPYSSMFLFLNAIPFGFQSHVFWGLVSLVQNLRVWMPDAEHKSLALYFWNPSLLWMACTWVGFLCVCVWDQVSVSPTCFIALLLSLGCGGSANPIFRLFSEETISYIAVVLLLQWEERSSGSSFATIFLFSWRQILKSYLYFFFHEMPGSYNLPVFPLGYLYFLIDLCELKICIWLALYLWYNLWIIPPVSCLSLYFVCIHVGGIYTHSTCILLRLLHLSFILGMGFWILSHS